MGKDFRKQKGRVRIQHGPILHLIFIRIFNTHLNKYRHSPSFIGGIDLILLVVCGVPFLASGHILGRVTPLGLVVVHLSDLASQVPGFDSVQTHVESLAIGGVWVFGVGNGLTTGISSSLLGAGESVLQLLC